MDKEENWEKEEFLGQYRSKFTHCTSHINVNNNSKTELNNGVTSSGILNGHMASQVGSSALCCSSKFSFRTSYR